jgi:hypothetical protein
MWIKVRKDAKFGFRFFCCKMNSDLGRGRTHSKNAEIGKLPIFRLDPKDENGTGFFSFTFTYSSSN